eukprot:109770_1
MDEINTMSQVEEDEKEQQTNYGEIPADLFTVTATNIKGYDISVDQTQAVVTLLALATGNDDLLKHYFKQYGNGRNDITQNSNFLLTHIQQELLMSGFTRNHFLPRHIPSDIQLM